MVSPRRSERSLLFMSSFCPLSVARCSEGLGRDSIQLLLSDDSLDVWVVGADGSVEFRVSGEDSVWIQKRLPSCSVVVSDMEAFLREAEEMAKPRVNASWFDAYVSPSSPGSQRPAPYKIPSAHIYNSKRKEVCATVSL